MSLGLKFKDLFGQPEEGEVSEIVEPVGPTPDENEKLLATLELVKDDPDLKARGVDNVLASHLGYSVHPLGVALPVRHEDGRVHGIQVRTGKQGQKYRWITPATYHVSPVSLNFLKGGFRICEGVIKADVSSYLTSYPSVAINGVSSWKSILPLVETMRPVSVTISFDQDWKVSGPVRRCRRDLAAALTNLRVDVYTEEWPEQYKGIDDYLAAGQPVCGIERVSYNP